MGVRKFQFNRGWETHSLFARPGTVGKENRSLNLKMVILDLNVAEPHVWSWLTLLTTLSLHFPMMDR